MDLHVGRKRTFIFDGMSRTLSFLICIPFLLQLSCKDQSTPARKTIEMGDTSSIVTETDPAFLENKTEDISPANRKSTEGKITSMMREVDSAHSAQKLEQEGNSTPVQGFTIHFAECDVVFEGLSAHALKNTQDERASNSVAYLHDAGNLDEIALQLNGLEDLKVEQRLFTHLLIQIDEKTYTLNDLGKFITPWATLAGKDTKFISLGNNSLQFFQVTQEKLKAAFERELRKKHLNHNAQQSLLQLLKKTRSYTDAPCKVEMVSSQWRITGKKNGKRIQKLVQIDLPA